ncbi:uncharacterized protein LOC114258110 isoform X2 [Camellia sinensis]|nr:uncharacterized protein LOC114258110 isoform X2 [Camellia sinensis]XP_028053763.1 uncharacterized protein LOC114258110 isoform X2 [Camellia sinensis]
MASSPSLKIVDHAPASSASIAASLASCASPLATCVAAAFHPGLLHKLCDVERCSVSLRWCKIICVLSTKQKRYLGGLLTNAEILHAATQDTTCIKTEQRPCSILASIPNSPGTTSSNHLISFHHLCKSYTIQRKLEGGFVSSSTFGRSGSVESRKKEKHKTILPTG